MTPALSTVRREIDAVLDRMDTAAPLRVADRVLAARRVFTAGEGRSGFMARAFAMRLMHLGRQVYVVGETISPAFASGDLLVAVSGSGATPATVHHAEQMLRGDGQVLAVTTGAGSPLASMAAETLLIPAATKRRANGESPTEQPLGSLFDQCAHIVLDAVCLDIARRQSVTLDEARARHAAE